jgi:fructokinase
VEKVDVKDTVGAGDTFFSALLTFLYEGGYLVNAAALAALTQDTLTACLRFANRAAAINCTREGADPPYRSEMD